MRANGLAALGVALMCFQSQAATVDPVVVGHAKQAIGRKLKDPQSARYSGISRRSVRNPNGHVVDVVCGAVNAKNSFGGYGGARPFAYLVTENLGYVAGDGDYLGDLVVSRMCK